MDEHGGEPRIRISGPGGLLAVVPNALGFHPTDSLVMMCFAGERPTLGPVARFDLPRGRDDAFVRQLTGTALAHADRVVLVCYSPHRRRPAVLDDLITGLLLADVGVLNVLVVHAGRFWEAPTAGRLRPAEGHPIPDRQDSVAQALAAENAMTGRVVLADRRQLRESIAGPRGSRRRTAEHAIREVARGRLVPLPDPGPCAPAGSSDPIVGGRLRPDHLPSLPERIDRALDCALAQVADRGAVDVRVAAELAVACLDRPVRDGILVRGLFELDRTWLSMLISCSGWTPDPYAAGICSVLAVIAYRHGDGGLAQVSTDRCLLAEPGNRLVHLLIQTMSAGLPPRVLDGLLAPPDDILGDLPRDPGDEPWDSWSDHVDGDRTEPGFGGDGSAVA